MDLVPEQRLYEKTNEYIKKRACGLRVLRLMGVDDENLTARYNSPMRSSKRQLTPMTDYNRSTHTHAFTYTRTPIIIKRYISRDVKDTHHK